MRTELVESENFPPSARNLGPRGRGPCLPLGVPELRPPVLQGLFFLFGLRGSRPPPFCSGGILRLQLRTSHLGPSGPRRWCAPGRAPRECRARDPLTLLSRPRAVHAGLELQSVRCWEPPAWSETLLNRVRPPCPSLGSPLFSPSLGSSQSKAAMHVSDLGKTNEILGKNRKASAFLVKEDRPCCSPSACEA